MKNDLIKRQDAIEALGERPAGDSDFDLGCRDQFDWDTEVLRTLPSAEPDNQVHLCSFCKYDYPECPAEMSDVIFGNGKGQDNVCACAKFEIKTERKKGKWLKEDLSGYFTPGGNSIYHCSECAHTEGPWPHPRLTNFCPSCGADMRGE